MEELKKLKEQTELLKQLQRLFHPTINLVELAQLIADLQEQFGADAELETIIQSLVGRHLCLQLTARRNARVPA